MVTEVDAEYLDHAFNVNLKSMMLACKYAIPAMSHTGGGSIINIASIDALRAGFTRNVPYAVTKAGAAQLSRVLAVHHGRQNIRVNCLAPGHIYGAFVRNLDEEIRTLRRKAGPLGTEGTAWMSLGHQSFSPATKHVGYPVLSCPSMPACLPLHHFRF